MARRNEQHVREHVQVVQPRRSDRGEAMDDATMVQFDVLQQVLVCDNAWNVCDEFRLLEEYVDESDVHDIIYHMLVLRAEFLHFYGYCWSTFGIQVR